MVRSFGHWRLWWELVWWDCLECLLLQGVCFTDDLAELACGVSLFAGMSGVSGNCLDRAKACRNCSASNCWRMTACGYVWEAMGDLCGTSSWVPSWVSSWVSTFIASFCFVGVCCSVCSSVACSGWARTVGCSWLIPWPLLTRSVLWLGVKLNRRCLAWVSPLSVATLSDCLAGC